MWYAQGSVWLLVVDSGNSVFHVALCFSFVFMSRKENDVICPLVQERWSTKGSGRRPITQKTFCRRGGGLPGGNSPTPSALGRDRNTLAA